MFKSISTFSALAGLLLAAACVRPVAYETRDGHLVLAVEANGGDAADEGAPLAVTITGLSRSYQARVDLGGAAAATELALPAGLYAVEGAARSGEGERAALVPVWSQPRIVVVAAGQVSSVLVRAQSTDELAALSTLTLAGAER